jgi:hypothetical protein
MLRNPVTRAYSHYLMKVQDCLETEVFEKAIELENERISGRDKKDTKGKKWDYAYLQHGFYAKKIREFLKYFPKANMKFIIFEEFINYMEKSIKEIFYFFRIEDRVDINYNIKSNPATLPRSKFIQHHIINQLLKRDNLIKKIGKKIISQDIGSAISHKLINLNRKPYKPPVMSEKTREYLSDIYREDIKQLEKIIEKDLSFWFK